MMTEAKNNIPKQEKKLGCLNCCVWMFLLCVFGFVVGAILITVDLRREWRINVKNELMFRSLREGKNTDDIQSMEISGLKKHFVISDRDSLQFLAKAFAKLENGWARDERISRCDFSIRFSDWECKRMQIAVYADMTGMEILFPCYDSLGIPYDRFYDVTFSEAPPPQLKEIFDALIEAWKAHTHKGNSSRPGDSNAPPQVEKEVEKQANPVYL
jgi:hypothetical protein